MSELNRSVYDRSTNIMPFASLNLTRTLVYSGDDLPSMGAIMRLLAKFVKPLKVSDLSACFLIQRGLLHGVKIVNLKRFDPVSGFEAKDLPIEV